MAPLATARQMLACLSMYPVDESSTKWKQTVCIAFPPILVICALCQLASFLTFIVRNIAMDFEECLFTLVVCISFIGIIYTMLTAFYHRHQIPSIFAELTLIYEASEFE